MPRTCSAGALASCARPIQSNCGWTWSSRRRAGRPKRGRDSPRGGECRWSRWAVRLEAAMMSNLRRLFTAVAVVAVMAVRGPVQAGLKTGDDLYQDCTQGNEREPFCLGYIVSVIAVNRALGGRICLLGNITVGQLRQVV